MFVKASRIYIFMILIYVRTIGKDTDENVQPSSNFKDFVVANETCLNLLKYLACKQNFKK